MREMRKIDIETDIHRHTDIYTYRWRDVGDERVIKIQRQRQIQKQGVA